MQITGFGLLRCLLLLLLLLVLLLLLIVKIVDYVHRIHNNKQPPEKGSTCKSPASGCSGVDPIHATDAATTTTTTTTTTTYYFLYTPHK